MRLAFLYLALCMASACSPKMEDPTATAVIIAPPSIVSDSLKSIYDEAPIAIRKLEPARAELTYIICDQGANLDLWPKESARVEISLPKRPSSTGDFWHIINSLQLTTPAVLCGQTEVLTYAHQRPGFFRNVLVIGADTWANLRGLEGTSLVCIGSDGLASRATDRGMAAVRAKGIQEACEMAAKQKPSTGADCSEPLSLASFYRSEKAYIVYQDDRASQDYVDCAKQVATSINSLGACDLPLRPLSQYKAEDLGKHRIFLIAQPRFAKEFVGNLASTDTFTCCQPLDASHCKAVCLIAAEGSSKLAQLASWNINLLALETNQAAAVNFPLPRLDAATLSVYLEGLVKTHAGVDSVLTRPLCTFTSTISTLSESTLGNLTTASCFVKLTLSQKAAANLSKAHPELRKTLTAGSYAVERGLAKELSLEGTPLGFTVEELFARACQANIQQVTKDIGQLCLTRSIQAQKPN